MISLPQDAPSIQDRGSSLETVAVTASGRQAAAFDLDDRHSHASRSIADESFWSAVTRPSPKISATTESGGGPAERKAQSQEADRSQEIAWSGYAALWSQNRRPSADPAVLQLVRRHFMPNVLSELGKLIKHAETPASAPYANGLMQSILWFCQRSPTDPATEVLSALFDAISLNGAWFRYTSGQYAAAFKCLADFSRHPHPAQKHVVRAIGELHRAGFDTLGGVSMADADGESDDR